MKDKSLHIVSFDNPFPPVYGGIVEVFYKLKPLYDLGIAIHLHCFVDEIPGVNPELDRVAAKVYYYKKSKSLLDFFSGLPFSVKSRSSKELLRNLEKVEAPILFEGLKTTYLVHKGKLSDRRKILRLHNIEHDYFRGVSASETNILRKWAYWAEALKYRSYEKVAAKFEKVVALSNFENMYMQEKYCNSVYVPVFHGNNHVARLEGTGKYAIYHGDLRMSDNRKVVRDLINIFKHLSGIELVIASSSGEREVKKMIGSAMHISFVSIKDSAHLKQLLRDAQLNMVFSYQRSGTKLKLMNALFNSRFCLINENITDDPNIIQLCGHASSKAEIISSIITLKSMPFADYEKRREVLEHYMNDDINATLLAQSIFEP